MTTRPAADPAPIHPVSVTTDDPAAVGLPRGKNGERKMRALIKVTGMPHTRIGHLLIVDSAIWRATIARHAAANDTTPAAVVEAADEAPVTADQVLAELGYRAR